MSDPRIPYHHDDAKPEHPENENKSGNESGNETPPASGPGPSPGPDTYNATVLGSHWFERPDPTQVPETLPAPEAPEPLPEAAPDRVEGQVLRFGPGVTAAVRNRHHENTTTAAALWHGTLPGQPPGPEPAPEHRSGGPRRYALAAAVLLAVLVFLAWQRYGPALAVQDVTVRTALRGPGCDGTSDIVGVVRTNGRPGTITYRWLRSDGTSSDLLREKVTRGQKTARLHLLWTFRGRGEYRATAELRITSPSRHTAVTRFVYRCV
ncbi:MULTISPECIES: hypothetical protein [unclassified Streptomyces]|uniref:hypothetical protein n=1 Tax=unclassified Streptomyces TaxID=2593676 RepID=UPI00081DE537|nr:MULTISPECIES: hypothetical protein [unclassified Streptomyces]SCF91145.1 hypothetical protein GA0115259_1047110 [Streptomyces sp. MnatMP-M17]